MKEQWMKTKYLRVNPDEPEGQIITEAALILRKGGLVAFPTETVYGLGANALLDKAVSRIFKAKGRPQDNPLIVHLAQKEAAYALAAEITETAKQLMDAFWPGPLTIIVKHQGVVSSHVTAGLKTVALRMPKHPVALALIKAAGVPVAAPSANQSGYPSPTSAVHVAADLDGRIDVILDGGTADVGLESTVVDATGTVPVILRPGGITPEEVQGVVGTVCLDPALGHDGRFTGRPKSPGMKYRHYAPVASLVLVEGQGEQVIQRIKLLLQEQLAQGKLVGIVCAEEHRAFYPGAVLEEVGKQGDVQKLAARLYDALRSLDRAGVDIILVEGVNPVGLGLAVANRLHKAAAKIVNTNTDGE